MIVDDFGVKYVGNEHAEHLVAALRKTYSVTSDSKGTQYSGMTLDWGLS